MNDMVKNWRIFLCNSEKKPLIEGPYSIVLSGSSFTSECLKAPLISSSYLPFVVFSHFISSFFAHFLYSLCLRCFISKLNNSRIFSSAYFSEISNCEFFSYLQTLCIKVQSSFLSIESKFFLSMRFQISLNSKSKSL